MTVEETLRGARLKSPLADSLARAPVRGLAYDSRQAGQDFLFFAFPGQKADGRVFAAEALARGATAVVSASPAPEALKDRWVEVEHGRQALGRVWGIEFHTAVFTNLTRDHLDFHAGMEDYFAAKRRLFEGAGARPPRFAAINYDDPWGRRLLAGGTAETLSYGLAAEARVRAENISAGFEGLRFEVCREGQRVPVVSALPGRVNVYNILAAWTAALCCGIPPDAIARGIGECRVVPGRFEKVEEGQPFLVVVDYAHTDDALRNVIRVARELNLKRVITLFGCGGDRDRSKRPLMGEAVAEGSDFAVLTSDNPRSEDPLAIINDALVGLRRRDIPHVVEPNREAAIRCAIAEAAPGDIVILAGKGHETYQVFADRTIPFDDRAVARKVLRGFGHRRQRA
jgi:UDP-N-acetylmuramoyl-L-alanyl-D-glutamate--2,6-diaminopimelate ligase